MIKNKKVRQLSARNGLQLPTPLRLSDFSDIIIKKLKYVNTHYIYQNKSITTRLLRTIGFQMPIELQQSGCIGSIQNSSKKVNKNADFVKEGMKYD